MIQDTIDSLCDSAGLLTLKYHWQVILLSTILCSVIYETSRIISPLLFPKTFQFFKGVSNISLSISAISIFVFYLYIYIESYHNTHDNNLIFLYLFEQYTPTNWHVHVVSTLHSILITVGSIYILCDGELAKNKIFGYSAWAMTIYSISCG